MKQALRMSSATAALAFALAAPALAQADTTPASSVPTLSPPSEDAVGPAQLKDFSLNGTVTRRAEPQPAAASPTTPVRSVTANTPETARPNPVAPATARADRPAAVQPQASAQALSREPSSPFNFTPSAPETAQPSSFAPGTVIPPSPTPVNESFESTETNLLSHWPWLLALIAAIGAGFWYFRRQRSGYAFAGGDASAFDFSPPARPEPRPTPPRLTPTPTPQPDMFRAPVTGGVTTRPAPAPAPASAPAGGIISTRLRPWVEIEFQPQAAIIDAEKGSIQFEVVLFNSGSAPARDVLVEAAMFNAGSDQDQLLGNFFNRATPKGADGTVIPPLQRMSFRSIVTLPRDQLRLFEVEGRTLFVPVVGFNAVYRWSGSEGQTSTSYIVGRNSNGEKMAPFLVEQGTKTYRGLGAREHSLGVRQ